MRNRRLKGQAGPIGLIMILAGVIVLAAGPALAQDVFEARQHGQRSRIFELLKGGYINEGQLNQLDQEQYEIEMARREAMADGWISPEEARYLDDLLDEADWHIEVYWQGRPRRYAHWHWQPRFEFYFSPLYWGVYWGHYSHRPHHWPRYRPRPFPPPWYRHHPPRHRPHPRPQTWRRDEPEPRFKPVEPPDGPVPGLGGPRPRPRFDPPRENPPRPTRFKKRGQEKEKPFEVRRDKPRDGWSTKAN